jgi:hypothetical protein
VTVDWSNEEFDPEPGPQKVEPEFTLARATDLNALYEKSKAESIRGAAYKTVATFAGLTRRKLWLREGNSARTDGHEIIAPFEHPYFYQILEHELSHILFQSDGIAKVQFIASYLAVMDDALKKQNTPGLGGLMQPLTEFMNTIVGVLEDVRCESLWKLLYPGSFELLQECHRKEVAKFMDRAHMSLGVYFIITSTGGEPHKGRFSRFRPALLEAMRKVERRSFGATLAVSKWLMQHLVSEALREMRGQPPPQKLKPAPPSPGPQPAFSSTEPSPALGAGETKDHVVPPEFKPEPVMADLTERFEGVKMLIADTDTPSALFMRVDDVQEGKFPSHSEKQRAIELARYVAKLNTADEAQLDQYLTGSEAAMQDIVEEAREALGVQMEVDDWITKNAFGKVNLKDVPSAHSTPLLPEDRDTVQKLRSVFFRVMGRRKSELQEQGSVIDVTAYVEALIAQQPAPCFQAEEKGRGFKVVLLIDRSGSMAGSKTAQAERACRILAKALDFPFVEFHIWGFQSIKNSELDISRFDTKRKDFTFVSKHAVVSGNTPLHLALRVVTRFMESGAESKQIICLTDGWPTHVSKKGHSYGTKTLSTFVREEVRLARRLGMNVTGVLIGKDAKDDLLSFMFGSETNWKRMSEKDFGDELVRLVSTSFVRYLRNG